MAKLKLTSTDRRLVAENGGLPLLPKAADRGIAIPNGMVTFRPMPHRERQILMSSTTASMILADTLKHFAICASAQHSPDPKARRAAAKAWLMGAIEHFTNCATPAHLLEPGWGLLLDLADLDVGVCRQS
jgi:hypothetical protein